MKTEEIPTPDKTLYVCKNNVGRSQMGMVYHNLLRPGEAVSAGTHVDKPGSLVRDWYGDPSEIIAAGLAEKIDIGANIRTQLNSASLKGIARVVIMAPEPFIEYLQQTPEDPGFPDCVEYWVNIVDPHNMPATEVQEVNKLIKQRVEELVSSIGKTACMTPRCFSRGLLLQVFPD